MSNALRLSPKQINDEKQKIYALLGESICAWSEVELELGNVFQMCMNPDPNFPASLPFWGIQNFRGMVDAAGHAIKALCFKEPDIMAEWRDVKHKLTAANKLRNKVAHGTVWEEKPRDRNQKASDVFLRRTDLHSRTINSSKVLSNHSHCQTQDFNCMIWRQFLRLSKRVETKFRSWGRIFGADLKGLTFAAISRLPYGQLDARGPMHLGDSDVHTNGSAQSLCQSDP